MAAGGSGPTYFLPGANHYRLIGLEVTRTVFPGPRNNLIQFLGPADHLVFDRLWIHGECPRRNRRRHHVRSEPLCRRRGFVFLRTSIASLGVELALTAQAITGGLVTGPWGLTKS